MVDELIDDELPRTLWRTQAYADAKGITYEELKSQMMNEAKADGGEGHHQDSRLGKLNLLQAYARTADLAVNAGVAVYNSSIGLFATRKKYRENTTMIDIKGTVKQLCAILGQQARHAPCLSRLTPLEAWLSSMAVKHGCQAWLSSMAVKHGCQAWLSSMAARRPRGSRHSTHVPMLACRCSATASSRPTRTRATSCCCQTVASAS
jgi:hypothetical protein